jgi:two-component system nitrogen regulation sensor histidine kinase NtrY
MRLRFAVSGHAAKAEVKEPAPETREAAHETAGPAEATNNETRIEAATGG